MTLTTHVAIAAALTKPLVSFHPLFSFAAAVASHYLSDAIPHWDYKLTSVKLDEATEQISWTFTKKSLLVDLSRITSDGLLGVSLVLFLLWPVNIKELIYILSFATGAVLPDFLQGLYRVTKTRFLKHHTRFHEWIHAKIKLGPYPLIGIPLQLAILLLALFLIL